MANLQQQIAAQFLSKLAESKSLDAGRIDQLRKLLADGNKLKPDELVKVFSLRPKGGVQ